MHRNILFIVLTLLSFLFIFLFPPIINAQTSNKCSLSPPEQSTLSEYASERGLNIGGLINTVSGSAANNWRRQLEGKETAIKEYQRMFVPYDHNWRASEKVRGVYDYTMFDDAINFAKSSGLKLHFYHLIWTAHNRDFISPVWLFPEQGKCGSWSKDELDQIMKTHIQDTINHAGDAVAVWNVVNEVFIDDGSILRDCFYNIIGPNYIDKAFIYAREASPNGLLVLNEYFGPGRMPRAKVDAFFAYVKDARNRNIPIDAIGWQNHQYSQAGEQFGQGYIDDINYFFQKAEEIQAKVLITEMDVYQAGHSQEEVARVYKDTVAACLKYKDCISFETWGISDKFSWPRQFYNLPDALPLLFDENYQRKPAYYSVMDAIKENTTRACMSNSGDANRNGKVEDTDYAIWRCDFLAGENCINPFSYVTTDFNHDQKINLIDFEMWRRNYY